MSGGPGPGGGGEGGGGAGDAPPPENEQVARRREKLAALREGGNPYPNDFRPTATAVDIRGECEGLDDDALASRPRRYRIAGRMMSRRVMGKASFAHVQDGSGRLQLYLRRDDLPEGAYRDFRRWDIGDLVGAEGVAFRTRPASCRCVLRVCGCSRRRFDLYLRSFTGSPTGRRATGGATSTSS